MVIGRRRTSATCLTGTWKSRRRCRSSPVRRNGSSKTLRRRWDREIRCRAWIRRDWSNATWRWRKGILSSSRTGRSIRWSISTVIPGPCAGAIAMKRNWWRSIRIVRRLSCLWMVLRWVCDSATRRTFRRRDCVGWWSSKKVRMCFGLWGGVSV